MTPKFLELSNFMSYKTNQVLDFDGISLACISGANGVGKSSILEAITWALWGKSRSHGDDDLVSQGQTSMWVDFSFSVGGSTYRVVRKRSTRGRGSSELYLHEISQGMQNITEDSIKKTQDKIEKIIRMPYGIFINSAYFRQGHADEFSSQTPTERKNILAQILDLQLYDELQERAKGKYRKLMGKIETLQIQIDDIKFEVAQKDILKKEYYQAKKEKDVLAKELSIFQVKLKSLQKSRDKYQKVSEKIVSLRDRIFDIKSNIEEIIQDNEKLKHQNDDLSRLLQEKTIIEKKVKEYKNLQRENDQMGEKLSKLSEIKEDFSEQERIVSEQKNKIEVEKSRISGEHKKELSMYREQVKNISGLKICPMCKQKITPAHIRRLKTELAGKLKKINNHYQLALQKINSTKIDDAKALDLKNKILHFDYKPDKHAAVKNRLNELAKYERFHESLISASENFKRNKENIAQNKIKIRDKLRQYRKIAKLGQKLKKIKEKLEPSVLEFDSISHQVEKKNSLLLIKQSEVSTKFERYSNIIKQEKELGRKMQERQKSAEELNIFQELAQIFGKKGIQKMVIESAVPEIEDLANDLLLKMTNEEMRISLETEREKKSDRNSLIETLDIKITDSFGKRDYELFSGGEAFRINFAIRVALSKLLARRAGASLKFLVIDEGFGTQDAEGRAHLVNAINSIKDEFEKILVITHIQELKDLFDQRIDVTKDSEGSHISVLG